MPYSVITIRGAYPNELYHHGIKGQKWGVRRFQNPDGTLTMAGKKRYLKDYDNSLKNTRSIANDISQQVKKDSRPPTGNQNCQLCTWCAEASFRGKKTVLPRPIYSPRDPALNIDGEKIVEHAERLKVKDYDNLINTIDSVQGNARYYVHVNWKGSSGGHEFLIIKNGNDKILMDPQVNYVAKVTKDSDYLTDINYENSYISRLDNKNFNTKLFEKVNNRKSVVPFTVSKDIPYMYENGMISKEEYEQVMKDPSVLYK